LIEKSEKNSVLRVNFTYWGIRECTKSFNEMF